MPLPAFAASVSRKLGCQGLRYASGGRPVRRLAVGGGACGEYAAAALAAGCDTFVTADLRYHDFLDAAAMGLNVIDAGHFQTENVVCPVLARRLRSAFPSLAVEQSASHRDVIQYYKGE